MLLISQRWTNEIPISSTQDIRSLSGLFPRILERAVDLHERGWEIFGYSCVVSIPGIVIQYADIVVKIDGLGFSSDAC